MVANQKPVPVSVYDYYDSSRRARTFYEPLKSTLCDICEGEECKKKCSEEKKSVSGNQRGNPSTSDDVSRARSQQTSSSFKSFLSSGAIIAFISSILFTS